MEWDSFYMFSCFFIFWGEISGGKNNDGKTIHSRILNLKLFQSFLLCSIIRSTRRFWAFLVDPIRSRFTSIQPLGDLAWGCHCSIREKTNRSPCLMGSNNLSAEVPSYDQLDATSGMTTSSLSFIIPCYKPL